MMEHILLAIYGAVWRVWDGRGGNSDKGAWKPEVHETLIRLSFLVPATLYAGIAVAGVGGWAVWIAAGMILNLHISPYKFIGDWRSPMMFLRYSTGALITVAPGLLGHFPLYIDGMPYIAVCVLAGLSYPVLGRFTSGKMQEYGAEAITGAVVVGGLV